MVSLIIALQALEPVVMSEVAIGPATAITGGSVSEIEVAGNKATVFVPEGWRPRRNNRVCLHFHSAPWYVVSQYQRTSLKDPVVAFNFGQGSTTYARPFESPLSWNLWVKEIESVLRSRMGALVVTSFSAGYGAVRNLIKQEGFLSKLETVVLSDSMYGSYSTPRTPLGDHVACWKPLADRARAGKTTVVMTCSTIEPETYCGTHEISRALVQSYGKEMTNITGTEGDQRLLRRYDEAKWHVWHYDGKTPTAHMTQARHMADVLNLIYR